MPLTIFVVLALWLFVGCEAQQPVEELPPVHPKPIMQPPTSDLPRGRVLVNVQQIALPLDQPTDPAWWGVDEDIFPEISRSVWNANGLRVGLINRGKLENFAKALPSPLSIKNSRLLASDHPSPIRRSATLRKPVVVDLTIPPLSVREEAIKQGRAQLLLNADAAGLLHLTPHHYRYETHLLPRTALEKELDGTVFHELGLAVGLGRQDVLVVGLYRPWPLLPTQENEGEEESEAKPMLDLERTPPFVRDLGSVLLTGKLTNHAAQLMLLITVEPLSAGDGLPQ